MIQVGIVGTPGTIRKYTAALGQIQNVRITAHLDLGDEGGSNAGSAISQACQTPACLIENADALIITGGSSYCNDVAVAALRAARHVFFHSRSVVPVSDVSQLMKLAREARVILRAGRLGRHSTKGLSASLEDHPQISMIELQHNYAIGDPDRPADMPEALLADLEVIGSLVKARVISIKAKGQCMVSPHPDILNARLEFDNGCAVNYHCNLVAAQSEFLGTLVLQNRILKYDFIGGELTSWFLHHPGNGEQNPLFIESIRVENSGALISELSDFIGMITTGPAFLSMNDNGFEPHVLAERILEKVMKTLVRCS